MDFERLLNSGIYFFKSNPIVAFALVIGLIIVATAKPKDIYKFIVFAVIMGVVLYILSQLGDSTSTGLQQKDKMINQTRKKDF